MTGIATAIYERRSPATPSASADAARLLEHADAQLDGIERLRGTYPFTIERSVKAYRLNHFLHALIEPDVARGVPRRSRRPRSSAPG